MPSKYIVDAISGSAVGRVGQRGTLIISSSLEIAPDKSSILTSKHITGSISRTYTGEQFIRVTGAGSDSYDPSTGQWTIDVTDTSDGRFEGWLSPQAGMLNATGSIAIAGGELGTSFVASDVGSDVFFFVSGTVGSLNTTNTGSAVFGGDLYVSGNLNAVGSSQFTHLTGSLSRTITGQEFLNAVGAGSVAYNDTTGQWTITVPTGDFGDGSGVGWTSPHDGMLNATGSIALAGGELTNSLVASDVGADIFLFVSGTKGSMNTSNTGSAVFGGDVVVSGSTKLGAAVSDTHMVSGSWHMSGTSGSFNLNEFKISLRSEAGQDHPFTIPSAMVMRTHPKFEGRSPQVCFGVDEPPYVGSNSTYLFAENMDTADLPPYGGGADFYEADMAFWFSGSLANASLGAYVSTFHLLRYDGSQIGALQGIVGASDAETKLSCSWARGDSMLYRSTRIRAKNDLHFGAGDPGPYDTEGSGQAKYGQMSQTSSMILFREGGLYIGNAEDGSRAETPVGGIFASGSTVFGRNTTATHRITGDLFITGSTIVQSSGKTHALFVNSPTDQVFILSGGGPTSTDEAAADDVAFYVSGTIGSMGTAVRGTSLFGGDLVVSGTIYGTIGGSAGGWLMMEQL